MLFSKNFVTALTGVRKLEKLVDQIQNKVREESYECSPDKNESEYGFFIKAGKDNLLWFGMWAEFSNKKEAPLCFGVQNSSGWGQATKAFPYEYKGETVSLEEEGWTLGWISQKDLASEDPVESIWAQLKPVLEIVTRIPPQNEALETRA